MKNIYHEGNRTVLEAIKRIERQDYFFRRFFCKQIYDTNQIVGLLKNKTDLNVEPSDLVKLSFLLNDPQSEKYNSWQKLNETRGYDDNIPLVGKLSPQRFWFEFASRGLFLIEKDEEVSEITFGEIPKSLRFVRTTKIDELNFLLSEGFNLRSEEERSKTSYDIDGMPLGLHHYKIYTLIR